ncbi:MAG: condensation domain-containing protein [Coriobacteriales bacterium]|jgi:hypothetical protein|nr:condensation domain-containing protein [Coriobacteriales bacterium]
MSDIMPQQSHDFIADNRGNTTFELPFQCRYPVQGLEFFDTGRTGRKLYTGVYAWLIIEGDLDLDRVEKAVQRMYDNIDTMRVTYPVSPDQPLHYRIRKHVDFKLQVFPVEEGTLEEQIASATAMETPFVMSQATYTKESARAVVYDLGTASSGKHAWIFALSANHIIVDDRGIYTILDQFMAFYRGEDRMIVHHAGLIDYLNYMNDNPDIVDVELTRAYWHREMAGYESPSLHEKNPDREIPISLGDFAFELDTKPIKELSLACQATMPSLFLAALHVGIAAGFDVRDSAVCMMSEWRPSFTFWSSIIHGLMCMNVRMRIHDGETFLEFARRTVLKTAENLHNLASEEYVGGAAHVMYTYVSPTASPDLGEGLTCQSWFPNFICEAGYLPAYFLTVVEDVKVMQIIQVFDQTTCFFTPNEVRAISHGLRRSLEIASENPGVLLSDIIFTVQAELREQGVISTER